MMVWQWKPAIPGPLVFAVRKLPSVSSAVGFSLQGEQLQSRDVFFYEENKEPEVETAELSGQQ